MRLRIGVWSLAALVLIPGCGPQFGALLYHSGLVPEEKTKTQFKLTQNKLAILVDDPTGALPSSNLRDDLQSTLAAELTEHKVCGAIVSQTEMGRVERTNRQFDTMSIRAIGEQVQAEQVIHVQILSFSVGDEAKLGVYQGRAKAMVKVCGTERKPDVRLWPPSGDGQSVEIAQPSEQTEQWNPNAKASDVYARTVAARLGKRIAMLFYEHTVEDERNLVSGRVEQPK
jgi:hypothetical protein